MKSVNTFVFVSRYPSSSYTASSIDSTKGYLLIGGEILDASKGTYTMVFSKSNSNYEAQWLWEIRNSLMANRSLKHVVATDGEYAKAFKLSDESDNILMEFEP
jgi:hypothetical protein